MFVTSMKTKAEVDEWLSGSLKIDWLRSQGYAKFQHQFKRDRPFIGRSVVLPLSKTPSSRPDFGQYPRSQ